MREFDFDFYSFFRFFGFFLNGFSNPFIVRSRCSFLFSQWKFFELFVRTFPAIIFYLTNMIFSEQLLVEHNFWYHLLTEPVSFISQTNDPFEVGESKFSPCFCRYVIWIYHLTTKRTKKQANIIFLAKKIVRKRCRSSWTHKYFTRNLKIDKLHLLILYTQMGTAMKAIIIKTVVKRPQNEIQDCEKP